MAKKSSKKKLEPKNESKSSKQFEIKKIGDFEFKIFVKNIIQ
jgi:hypothetical protein